MPPEIESLTFELALRELEQTVARLEGEELTLEESLALYERGQLLAAHCQHQLEQAALRVEQLTADGEIVETILDN
jgi:exodeoxyribonuclease VII small subunit